MTKPITASDRQIDKLSEAMGETDRRIILRMQDAMGYGEHDPQGRRYLAMVRRMEANNADRARQMTEIVCRKITGRSWKDFTASVGGSYAPSVSIEEHGEITTRIFAHDFAQRFGREVHRY